MQIPKAKEKKRAYPCIRAGGRASWHRVARAPRHEAPVGAWCRREASGAETGTSAAAL